MATKLESVTKAMRDLDDRKHKFFSVLDGEDDLGVVLRSHIHIEHELQEFILATAPKSEHIKFSDYDYDSKVALALVLGLDAGWKPALSVIGSLRNKFAHKLDMALSKQEINNLYNSFSADLKVNINEGWVNFLENPKYAGERWPKSMKQLPPRMLFGFYVGMLRTAIVLRMVEAHMRALGFDRKDLEEFERTGKLPTKSPN